MSEFPNKGTQFSSTNQPAKRGRKPSLIKRLQETLGDDELKPVLTKRQMTDLMVLMCEMDLPKLQSILEQKDLPILLQVVASAILKSGKNGDMRAILDIYSRAYGLPKQEIDIEQNSTSTNVNIYIPDNGRK